MKIEAFLEYITTQRLTHLPHRGSIFDKVLRFAEFFALQIANYAKAIGPFVPASSDAAHTIYVLLRVLLQV